jgi:glutaconate CoA-transferase subunit A
VKPNHPAVASLDALAARVASGSRLSVGGHHFARLPIALLRAVVDRRVTDLNYFAWAGGLPLELLLEAEAIAAIDICFSSLDIFGLPPRFRAVAEARSLPVNGWPALTMIQGLRAAQQNLPFMPVQLPEGSTMMERCPAVRFHRDARTGRTIGRSRRSLSIRCCCTPPAPMPTAMSRFMARGHWI